MLLLFKFQQPLLCWWYMCSLHAQAGHASSELLLDVEHRLRGLLLAIIGRDAALDEPLMQVHSDPC